MNEVFELRNTLSLSLNYINTSKFVLLKNISQYNTSLLICLVTDISLLMLGVLFRRSRNDVNSVYT